MSQAYIQSKSELLIDVYLNPGKELSITPDYYLKTLKP